MRKIGRDSGRNKDRDVRRVGRKKLMYGQHVRQTKDSVAQKSWLWLRRGSLKLQTESLIIVARDQA